MGKFRIILVLIVFGQGILVAQSDYERQYRIRKVQFPEKALGFIENSLADARKVRFYKETDSAKVNYEVTFRKDRLRYGIEFDKDGNLRDIEFRINEVDFPEDSFKKITIHLQKEFTKYRIRRMYQQYPLVDNNTDKTLENAFQNILLPSLQYRFIVAGKKDTKKEQYELLFDAKGNFLKQRKSLPPNYDHVLY